MTFAATASGLEGIQLEGRYLAELIAHGPRAAERLAAISCGAVLMGANTYIGNGPNFMVKAIAEENGVKMPSFFGYMIYSSAILLPLYWWWIAGNTTSGRSTKLAANVSALLASRRRSTSRCV